VAVFLAGLAIGLASDYPLRFVAKNIYQAEYSEHVYECDNAMRTHFIAKVAVESNSNEQNVKKLQASELGLIYCHEYDKFRKYLISLGLSDNDLSEMGLLAIEDSRTELNQIVKEHEIRY
jgi:hypothetical protein